MSRAGHYDAVIVGGGHNGLTAAAYLAQAGRSCLVLERSSQLGGAAVSERVFDGIDAHLSRYAYLVSLLPRRIVAELSLPLRLARRAISSYTPDPRTGGARGLLVDGDDPAGTLASFRAVTGSDADHRAWEGFHAMLRRVAHVVFPTLTEPLRSRDQMRALIDDDVAWRALFEEPLGDLLARVFRDELVSGVVLTDALIGTFARAGEAGLSQNRCFLYHVIGDGTGEWKVPVGGMGAVSGALAAAAARSGAELRTHVEVLRLDPCGSHVDVWFAEGGEGAQADERAVHADRVLVNAAPAELERLLGRPTQAGTRPEGSQLKLNMLLSRLPALKDRGMAVEDAFIGTFHVNEGFEQIERAYNEAAAGAIPRTPPCEAYCHSLTDASILGPALRQAGAHTLTVFALHMPARLFARDPVEARTAAAEATLRSLDSVLGEPIWDCLLRTPAGEPCIEARSPLDIEAELRMPGGHIFHRDLRWPFAESAEEIGTWGVETEHSRILLCGAGARRGGAVSGIPGRNAAMAVLAAAGPSVDGSGR